MENNHLLTLRAAANHLQVPLGWLKAEAKAGHIPCLKVGRRFLFNIEAVEDALLARAGGGQMTHTVKTLAQMFQVSPHTVLSWIRNGTLKAINVSPNIGKKPQWRITQAAIESFEQTRTSAPPPAKLPRKRKRESDYIRFYS